ncbi:DUF397 domain-containing protein [Actinomadura keratinilytica]|jgi:hypothetical protein
MPPPKIREVAQVMFGSDVNSGVSMWRKSSHSGSGNACVEVADLRSAGVAVRDSKDPSGPVLMFGRSEFVRLAEAIRRGTFDLER